MTLTLQKVSVAATILILLSALGIFFLGNQRQAHAAVPPHLGSAIVCKVFTDLNELGEPIPILDGGDCHNPPSSPPQCSDGIDNDGNGVKDFPADPGCSDSSDNNEFTPAPTPPACSNDLDDDNDGFIDENDPNCHTDGDPNNASTYNQNGSETGSLPACWNNQDDDGDGLKDFPADPGCSSATDTDEQNGSAPGLENTLGTCSDSTDNDEDSLVDLSDPDCSAFMPPITPPSATTTATTTTDTIATSTTATTTTTTTPPACSDGTDNDGDGKTDSVDPGCDSADDTDEANAQTTGDSGGTSGGGSSGSGSGGGSPSTGSGSSSGGGGGGGSGGSTFIGVGFGAPATSTQGTVLGAAADAPPVAANESCDQYLTAFIKSGSKNDQAQVKRLQYVLRDFEGNASLQLSGTYDAATLAAVHAFQMKYASDILAPWGISRSTGFTYLTTRKKINEIYCRNTKQFPLNSEQLQTIAKSRALAQAAAPAVTKTTPMSSNVKAPVQKAALAPATSPSPSQEVKKNFWDRILDAVKGVRVSAGSLWGKAVAQ